MLFRSLEIFPGVLTWSTLIGAPLLAYFHPVWISLYVILFDLYWFLKGANVAVHLMHSHYELKAHQKIDWNNWLDRLVNFNDFKNYLAQNDATQKDRHLRNLYRKQLENLNKLPADRNYDYKRIYHLVVLATVQESMDVLESSVASCAHANYDHDKIIFVLATEERAGEIGKENARLLTEKFGKSFGHFMTSVHPDGIEGEAKVKGANVSWAGREAQKYIEQKGIPLEDVIISAFDADSMVSRNYFAHLTYDFLTALKPLQNSYQPMPMFHNNIWDTPAIARVIATSSSFWQLIEASRPDRLVTFSSHAMSFKTLVDIGFWRVDIIPDDSHIFWQAFLHYDGDYRSKPLFTTVSMDAVLGHNYVGTLIAQYKQKRRWAWGVTEVSMVIPEFIKNKKIPLWKRLLFAERLIESHYFWATASIMIAILGWLPLIFGGDRFGDTVLAYNLPTLTRTIMTIATFFLVFSVYVNMVLLPKRPAGYSKWKNFSMIWQWVFSPIVASLFGSIPAIDAQTRLMFGKYMEFYVTPKFRKGSSQSEIASHAIKSKIA